MSEISVEQKVKYLEAIITGMERDREKLRLDIAAMRRRIRRLKEKRTEGES